MRKINLCYYNAIKNFGDQLNDIIFKDLFGVYAVHSLMRRTECVAIGSLLQGFLCKKDSNVLTNLKENLKTKLYPSVKVYGTGFMGEIGFGGYEERFHRRMEFYALRGKLTKERVEKIERKSLNRIVLGDPGLLLSKIFDKDSVIKKYKYGIVPHFLDKMERPVKFLKEMLPHSCVIDVTDDVIKTTQRIAECEFIISTAMHGLIAADSLGVPNVWAKVSDNIVGEGYKFRDYYSVFDMNEPVCIDLRQDCVFEREIVAQIKDYMIDFKQIEAIQNDLIRSFPYNSSFGVGQQITIKQSN